MNENIALCEKTFDRHFGKLGAVIPVGNARCRELWFQDTLGNVHCVEASTKSAEGKETPLLRLTLFNP